MAMPDLKIIQKNLEVLEKLDDDKLIMLALSELMMALSMTASPGVPPAKAIAFCTELTKRAGIKSF